VIPVKTATITLGGKEYAAAPLQTAEIEAGLRAYAQIRRASSPPAGIDTSAIAEGTEELVRIICGAVRRMGPDVDPISSEITHTELLYAFLRLKESGGVM
jgi:hypothetical protein